MSAGDRLETKNALKTTVVGEQRMETVKNHSLDWIYFDIFVRKRLQGQIQSFLHNKKYKVTLNEKPRIIKNFKNWSKFNSRR